MLARILTGAVLIPIVVALVWYAPPLLLAAIASGVAILALLEFFRLAEGAGLRAFRGWTIVSTLAIFLSQAFAGVQTVLRDEPNHVTISRGFAAEYLSLDVVLIVFLLGSAIIILATRRPIHEALPAIGASSAGLLFIALPFSYLVRLNEIPDQGRQLVLFTLCLVWAGDIVAYFVGRGIGRVRMAPILSPKKTWEGAAGNLAASIAVGYAFARWMQAGVSAIILIAALANIAGQIGDLLESAYKRGASVKDSGGILPGHGGMLDRIDSLILAAPVVWVLFLWFGRAR